MFESICQDSESQRLRFGNSLVSAATVDHNARKFRNFADPSTIGFALDIHREVAHDRIVQRNAFACAS